MMRQFLLCAVFFLFCIPLILLVWVFHPPVFPASILHLLVFSFSLAACGTALALFIGLPVSFSAARDSFFAQLLNASVLVPFFLPINIASVLIYQIFDHIQGIFSLDLRGSFIGLVLAHGFYEVPIIIFYVSLALRSIPSVYFAQMQEDGLSSWRQCAFCLQMIRKQIFQAAAIVFLYIFQSTALVMNVGLGRFETLESAILLSFGPRADFSVGLGLGLVQSIFLFLLFWVSSFGYHIHFSLSKERQIVAMPINWASRLAAFLFFLLAIYWFSPLFIQAWQGMGQLWQVRTLFPLFSSLLNSLVISFLAAAVSVVLVLLWMFYQGGRGLIYTLFISAAMYFSGVMLCGFLWNIPAIFLAIWALSLSLIPMVYFFLLSGKSAEDEDIIRAARLDDAQGYRLWASIYWPLWKERYINAFWKAVLLALGNFPFAYIMAQNKIPMAAMTLSQLLNRRYIGAANAYAGLIFMLILVMLLFLLRREKTN